MMSETCEACSYYHGDSAAAVMSNGVTSICDFHTDHSWTMRVPQGWKRPPLDALAGVSSSLLRRVGEAFDRNR